MTQTTHTQKDCGGIHCKCMNLGGQCGNYHFADHYPYPETAAPQSSKECCPDCLCDEDCPHKGGLPHCALPDCPCHTQSSTTIETGIKQVKNRSNYTCATIEEIIAAYRTYLGYGNDKHKSVAEDWLREKLTSYGEAQSRKIALDNLTEMGQVYQDAEKLRKEGYRQGVEAAIGVVPFPDTAQSAKMYGRGWNDCRTQVIEQLNSLLKKGL